MRRFKLLKVARVIVSLLVLVVFLAGFSSLFSGAGLLAKAEYQPAISRTATLFAAASLLMFVLLLAGTLFFGRFYCSLLCPLGVLQDIAARLGKILSFGRFRYKTRPDHWKLRYTVWILLVALAFGGWIVPVSFLDPYTLFGRNAAGPGLELFSRINNFFYGRFDFIVPLEERPGFPLLPALIAGVIFLAVLLAAAWRGRIFCNTFCPTGMLLGLLSRYSRFQLRIDPGKCVKCGQCAKVCKTGCIDVTKKFLHFERCVDCMNCGSVCRFGAVGFAPVSAELVESDTPPNLERREFLALAGSSGLIAFLGGRLARRMEPRIPASGRSPVMPPGAGFRERFNTHCTGCGLCIANCTGRVLVPAFMEYGLAGMGQPRLAFRNGMCEFDCHKCTQICPTGALKPMTLEEKKLCRIGRVQYFQEKCVVVTDGRSCGACAEHCPTGALQMVPYKGGITIPEVISDLCIGCGACQYICPVEEEHFNKAIMVFGVDRQTKADSPEHILGKPEEKEEKLEDFPF